MSKRICSHGEDSKNCTVCCPTCLGTGWILCVCKAGDGTDSIESEDCHECDGCGNLECGDCGGTGYGPHRTTIFQNFGDGVWVGRE